MLPAVLYGSPLPTISHKTHDLLQISQTATPGCRIAAQAGLAWAPLFLSCRHSSEPAHIVRSRIPPPLFVPLNIHGRIFSLCLKCQEILQSYVCRQCVCRLRAGNCRTISGDDVYQLWRRKACRQFPQRPLKIYRVWYFMWDQTTIPALLDKTSPLCSEFCLFHFFRAVTGTTKTPSGRTCAALESPVRIDESWSLLL